MSFRLPPTVRRILAVVLASLALAMASFLLFSWHYDVLPYDYHPDEPGKVAQIVGDWRNFYHPLLMLETTSLTRRFLNVLAPTYSGPNFDQHMQKLAELGRLVCAGYAAGAVVLLALAGGLLAGWRGGLAVGICCGLLHPLVIFAHDFKEDTTLCFGLALFALVAVAFWQTWAPFIHRSIVATPNAPRRVPSAAKMSLLPAALGLASGVASSGKYVGLATLPVALLLALAAPAGRRGWKAFLWRLARALWVLTGWAAAFSTINWRIFSRWPHFLNGFLGELEHGLSEHNGIAATLPNGLWLRLLGQQLTRPVWLGLFCYLVFQITCRRTSYHATQPTRPSQPPVLTESDRPLAPGSWIIPGLALLYLGMLLVSPLFFSRYALPVFLLLHATAGLGLVAAAHAAAPLWDCPARKGLPARSILPHPTVTPTLAALLLLVVAVQLPLCLDSLRQIRQDSRLRFLAWVRANLPPGSYILQDSYVGLPTGWLELDDNRGRIQVYCPGIFAADRSTLTTLLRGRFTHVAVCDLSYGRLFEPRIRPTPGNEGSYQRRRGFYEQLFRRGILEWEYVPYRPTGGYVNPTIRLYRLPPPPTPARQAPRPRN